MTTPTRSASPPVTQGTGDRLRLFALAALTAVLIGLCLLLAYPFLPAITWGVALAIVAWPMYAWLRRRLARPGVAAGISTAVVVAVIIVPGVVVTYQLAQEAAAAAGRVQEGTAEGGWRAQVAEVPVVNRVVAWMDKVGVDVEAEVRNAVGSYAGGATSLAQGSLASAVQFLMTVFILFFLFRDSGAFLGGLRELLPLSRAETDRVLTRATDSVHANIYATVITSLIDSVGSGLLFWAIGLPAPLLWASVMFVLALLPVVGAGLVWLPAVLYLALAGRLGAAGILLAWGVGTFILVDNLLYARLAGGRMRMHEMLTLVAFMGGLALFGISGMVLGPAILAVATAFLEVWKGRMARSGSVEGNAGPPPVLADNPDSGVAFTGRAASPGTR